MIVRDAKVAMSSERAYSAATTRRESLRSWVGTRRPGFIDGRLSAGSDARGSEVSDEATIEGQAPSQATALQRRAAMLEAGLSRPTVVMRPVQAPTSARTAAVGRGDNEGEDDGLDAETRILKWVAEQFLGVKIRVVRVEPHTTDCQPGAAASASQATAQAPVGWGVEYERTDTYTESEATSFEADGWVETESGERIAVNLSLRMAREYSVASHLLVRAGDATRTDPLVVNLGGSAAQLTDVRFDFDLDADGDPDSVPFVTGGSGVLVFDRNADGVANDGSELFGPATGDGFAELAALDGDGNGWVDEGDAAAAQLLVWTKDAAGNDRMQTLAQAGVGAIYLGRAETRFAVRGEGNSDLGEVVSTGLYLGVDGYVGSVQQVNLTA